MAFGEELMIRLGLNRSGFDAGLNGAKAAVGAFQKTLGSIGGLVGVGGFAALARSAASMAGEINTTAQSLGVGVEFLQKFQYAAEQNGSTAEKASAALGKLSVAIGQALAGSMASAQTFSELGVSLYDSSGLARKTEDIFYDVADALAAVKDPAYRAAKAQDIFGKSGVDLLATVGQGSEALKKYGDEAISLGRIMSEKTVKALDEADTALKNIGRTIKASVGTSLAWAHGHIARLSKVLGAISAGQSFGDAKMTADRLSSGEAAANEIRKESERVQARITVQMEKQAKIQERQLALAEAVMSLQSRKADRTRFTLEELAGGTAQAIDRRFQATANPRAARQQAAMLEAAAVNLGKTLREQLKDAEKDLSNSPLWAELKDAEAREFAVDSTKEGRAQAAADQRRIWGQLFNDRVAGPQVERFLGLRERVERADDIAVNRPEPSIDIAAVTDAGVPSVVTSSLPAPRPFGPDTLPEGFKERAQAMKDFAAKLREFALYADPQAAGMEISRLLKDAKAKRESGDVAGAREVDVRIEEIRSKVSVNPAQQRQMSQQVLQLESIAKQFAAAGNMAQAQGYMSAADRIRGGILSLKSDERTPFKAMEDQIALAQASLDEAKKLNESVSAGLKVIPLNSK